MGTRSTLIHRCLLHRGHLVPLFATIAVCGHSWHDRLLRLVKIHSQIALPSGHHEVKLLDKLRIANFYFLSAPLLVCYLNLDFVSELLLILAHLLHCGSKILSRFNNLTCSFACISLPPPIETLLEALEVCYHSGDFTIGYIPLILQLMDLPIDNFLFSMEITL